VYTAADGVSTSVPGFEAFYGTSASVAHAAAIASLVLSGNRNDDLANLRAAFDAGSLDLAPAGVDSRSGHGVLRADHVLDVTGATPQARARASGVRTVTSSDGDAFLEPGETAAVALTVRNEGDRTATGVTVTVEAAEPGVTVSPQSRPYPDIAADATATQNLEVTLPADHPLGKPLVLRVRVRFAGDLSPTAATLSLPVGRPSAAVRTFAYSGPPVPIPDSDPAGAEAAIEVTGIGFASRATFSIDGDACTDVEEAETVGLDHTFVSDLAGTLIAPDGTAVRLFVNPDGSGNNLCQAVFDDAAERSLEDASSDEAPFTGSWRPVDAMSGLLGIPADGTWTFRVEDERGADAGNIRAVSLHLAGFEAP
jgi:subtilisin-like proprotein convertase family protein